MHEMLDRVLEIVDYWTEDNAHYMLGGNSIPGLGHFVLAKGGKIVHDPANIGLCGPQDDGYWWVGLFGKIL